LLTGSVEIVGLEGLFLQAAEGIVKSYCYLGKCTLHTPLIPIARGIWTPASWLSRSRGKNSDGRATTFLEARRLLRQVCLTMKGRFDTIRGIACMDTWVEGRESGRISL